MAAKLPLTNFSKGEFAPRLYARIDVPQYSAGAKKIRNFIIQREGGLSFRPGFRFVGEVSNFAHQQRMIPFMFSQDQAYVKLLGNYSQEVLAKGGWIVEENLSITAATKETQAVLTIPFHGMGVGDRLALAGNTGMALDGRVVAIVAIVDANNVRTDLNTTGFANLTASTGVVRTGAPTAPPAPPAPLPDPTPAPAEPFIGDGDSGPGSGPSRGGYLGLGAGGYGSVKHVV